MLGLFVIADNVNTAEHIHCEQNILLCRLKLINWIYCVSKKTSYYVLANLYLRRSFNLLWYCRLLWCQKPKGQPTLLTVIFSSSDYLLVRTILQYYCSSVLFLVLLVSSKYYQTVHYINNVLSIQSIGSFCKKPKTRYVDISLLYNLMIIRVKKTWRERNSLFLTFAC